MIDTITTEDITAIRRVLNLPATARIDVTRNGWDHTKCYYSNHPCAVEITWYTGEEMFTRAVAADRVSQTLADIAEYDPTEIEYEVSYWWARYCAAPEIVLAQAA